VTVDPINRTQQATALSCLLRDFRIDRWCWKIPGHTEMESSSL